jgi:5-methyltetrahydrofolate--homocysteine methyltransferase
MMNSEHLVMEEIARTLEKGDAQGVKNLVEEALKGGIPAVDLLNNGLIAGMDNVGFKFKNNEIFIPEVLIAERAMKAGMELIKPLLVDSQIQFRGKVIIGTVKGDIHDIGKNIVAMMLEGGGYEVINMGTQVSLEMVVENINEHHPEVLGLSALLTTTMVYMGEVIDGLKQAGLRDQLKVIIGGAPITQAYADEIHADGYAPDAATAVDLVRTLLK